MLVMVSEVTVFGGRAFLSQPNVSYVFIAAEFANCARRRNVESENLVKLFFFSKRKEKPGKLRLRFLSV